MMQDREDMLEEVRSNRTPLGERSDASLPGKLFVYNYQYRSLSGFEKKLADLLFHADIGNQKRLLKAFPLETAAVMAYQSKEGWWEECEKDVLEFYNNKR